MHVQYQKKTHTLTNANTHTQTYAYIDTKSERTTVRQTHRHIEKLVDLTNFKPGIGFSDITAYKYCILSLSELSHNDITTAYMVSQAFPFQNTHSKICVFFFTYIRKFY